MFRKIYSRLLDRQARELKMLGVYLVVILILFAICLPGLGKKLAEKETRSIPTARWEREIQLTEIPISEKEIKEEEQSKKPEEKSTQASVSGALNKEEVVTEVLKEFPQEISWPLLGEVITEYGMVYAKTFSDYRFHNGIDIKAQRGDLVKNVFSGKVISVETSKAEGKKVVIDHNPTWQSIYTHLGEVFVKTDELVEEGKVIGQIGQPGMSEVMEGPHLHFTLLKNKEAVNPIDYLKK